MLTEKFAIPFPLENHMDLGAEVMNVFDADIAFLMYPGMGQFAKAVLMKNKFAVCVCRNKAQKDMLMTNLKAFAKSMNLVNLSGAPSKPAAMLDYEKKARAKAILATQPAAAPKSTDAGSIVSKPAPPPPPAVITVPPPPAVITVPPPTAASKATAKLQAFGSSLLG